MVISISICRDLMKKRREKAVLVDRISRYALDIFNIFLKYFFYNFFSGLEGVGPSFANVAHFVLFLRDV
jgi:hypothetical protein